MKKHLLTAISFLLLVAGCATLLTQDIQIKTDVAPNADFSAYESYSWLGSAAVINDSSGRWEPPGFDADTEIRFLIDRELRGRGMIENFVDPDLVVAFTMGIDMETLRIVLDPESSLTTIKNVPQGALVVILIDASSGAGIWAGLATGEVQKDPGPDVIQKRLEFVINSMFKDVPK